MCTYIDAGTDQLQIHLRAVVRPRTEAQPARVHLEGPVREVQVAVAVEYRRGDPDHAAVLADDAVPVAVVLHAVGSTTQMRGNYHMALFLFFFKEGKNVTVEREIIKLNSLMR